MIGCTEISCREEWAHSSHYCLRQQSVANCSRTADVADLDVGAEFKITTEWGVSAAFLSEDALN